MRRVGILGGTFDPPHQAHLIMADFVLEGMVLDEIWFLPSHIPPHKKQANVSANDRLAMVKKAIADHPKFQVCDIELARKGTSYTVDTMVELKDNYPEHRFYFIIGGDMVEHLPKWNNIDKLSQLVEFIGVMRPGFKGKTELPVHYVDIPLVEISSSNIRKRIHEKKTVRYLMPDSVYHYIKEQYLYEDDA